MKCIKYFVILALPFTAFGVETPKLLQNIAVDQEYSVDAKIKIFESFATELNNMQKIPQGLKTAYKNNLKSNVKGNLTFTDFVNKYAQQAAPTAKAPEGISDDFKNLVEQVKASGDKQDDAIEALRYLFGEANPQSQIYQDAGINNPEQRDDKQPGAQLKNSIGYQDKLIST